jgi:RNA polymerase sigma factor (sigma-70 family)
LSSRPGEIPVPDHPILAADIQALVRRKVRAMTLYPSSRLEDRDDHSQHLLLKLLEAWPRYDPDRSPFIAFAERVLQRAVAHHRRDRQAKKRRAVIRPLGDDGIADPRSETDGHHTDLRLDVHERLQSQPPRHRALAERLKAETPAAVARELGIASSTLRGRLAQLRRPFEDLDLRKFL